MQVISHIHEISDRNSEAITFVIDESSYKSLIGRGLQTQLSIRLIAFQNQMNPLLRTKRPLQFAMAFSFKAAVLSSSVSLFGLFIEEILLLHSRGNIIKRGLTCNFSLLKIQFHLDGSRGSHLRGTDRDSASAVPPCEGYSKRIRAL